MDDPALAPAGSISEPFDSQPSTVAFDGRPALIPETVTPVTAAVWRSARSASAKRTAPAAVSTSADPMVEVRSAIAPESVPPATINGASLVPVTVTVTAWVSVPPAPSKTWMS